MTHNSVNRVKSFLVYIIQEITLYGALRVHFSPYVWQNHAIFYCTPMHVKSGVINWFLARKDLRLIAFIFLSDCHPNIEHTNMDCRHKKYYKCYAHQVNYGIKVMWVYVLVYRFKGIFMQKAYQFSIWKKIKVRIKMETRNNKDMVTRTINESQMKCCIWISLKFTNSYMHKNTQKNPKQNHFFIIYLHLLYILLST